MGETSTRWSLPLLAAGQAQKEIYHNEALTTIDALLHPIAEALGADTPPTVAVPGQSWIVGDAPGGDWAGHARAVATLTDGGWRFAVPAVGMTVWVVADGTWAVFGPQGWTSGLLPVRGLLVDGIQVVGAQLNAIAEPAGGTAIDPEAREAIAAILDALRQHGLVAR